MKSPSYRSARRHAGFTLIELLTVIAIIGILAAIIIPTVGSVREKAKTAQCASRLRQWGSAVNLYAADNRNVYWIKQNGEAGFQPWCMSGDANAVQEKDRNRYAKYFNLPNSDLEKEVQGGSGMMYCPTVPEAKDMGGNTPDRAGYAMIWPTLGSAKIANTEQVPMSRASTPSRTLLMIDRNYTQTSGALTGSPTGPGATYSIENEAYIKTAYNNFTRHNTYANAVFLDGSVRRMKWNTGDANTSLSTGGALGTLNRQWLKLDQ